MDKRQIEIEVLKEAVKEHCSECANNEPVTFDPDMQHYYHFDGDLGCLAAGLHRMISERMSDPYIPQPLSNDPGPAHQLGTDLRDALSAIREIADDRFMGEECDQFSPTVLRELLRRIDERARRALGIE